MEKIRAVKEKYCMPSEEDLIHDFQMDFHRMEEILREREEQLIGVHETFRDLKSKVDEIETAVCTEKQLLNAKLQSLNSSHDRLSELKSDKNSLLQEVHNLDVQRNAMKNSKPNLKDQQILDLGIKKLKYYKQLTGIRWDFGAPKGITKGYVTNGTDYIHSFNYKTYEYDSKLEALLWKEIEKATERSEVTKIDENTNPNNYNILL